MSRRERILKGVAALVLAAGILLACIHFLFSKNLFKFRRPAGLSTKAEQLAARNLQLWTEPESRKRELDRMRASNAEWDFMGRTFLVWSFAEMGLRKPEGKAEYLKAMDE